VIGPHPLRAQRPGWHNKIEKLPTNRQNQKPAVLSQNRQTSATLILRPADPSLARGQVPSRATPPQQGHPLALVTGRITQLLADQRGVVQVMTLDDGLVPTLLLLAFQEQMNFQSIKDALFLDSGQAQRFGHAIVK